MESPNGVEADKEGVQNIPIENVVKEVSKNMGESVRIEKESHVNFGVPGVGKDIFQSEGRSNIKKRSKGLKKGNRNRVGHIQDKMVSVDSRPSSRKRPRLDFDHNGLDPFGLDALLGIYNENNLKESNVGNGLSHEKGNLNGDVSFISQVEVQEGNGEGRSGGG
ncbi:hypothetical protein Hanom_Chr12g01108101 [Helianthus anomalus]